MLKDSELKKEIEEAKTKNVSKMISNSTSFQSNEFNLRIQKSFPEVKAALGLYPLDALELNDAELEKAFKWFEHKATECIAFGEVGMDFKYAKTDSEKEKQEEIFRKFIFLAKKYNKPLIVHSRYAQSQVLKILESEKAEKFLLHSFVDSEKLMKQAAEQGYFVSVGMIILESEEVQARIKEFPLENLLLETDCPIRFSGEKAMPKDIVRIAEKVAELKSIPLEKLGKSLNTNFKRLFG